MNIKYGYPKFMPSPYSIYASDFGEELLREFKSSKFARYHADSREYEISPELFEKVKSIEPVVELNKLPKGGVYNLYKYGEDYPYQYQDDAVEFMQHTDFALINFGQGMGKADVNGTMVKTPNGDIKIENLRVGDYVFGDDGKPALVSATYSHKQLDAYELKFSDGSKTRCLDNHIWTFYDRHKKKNFDVVTTDLVAQFNARLVDSKWQLPRISPLEYPEKDLPIDPYLLGCLIGDGGLTGRTISFTTISQEIKERISQILRRDLAMELRQYRGRGSDADYCISYIGSTQGTSQNFINKNGLIGKLNSLGLRGRSEAKFIPLIYLHGDIGQRKQLLAGLLDTDGYLDKKNNTLSYTTVSNQLKEDVIELVEGLGHYCRVTEQQGNYVLNGHRKDTQWTYTVSIRPNSEILTYNHKTPSKRKFKPRRMLRQINYIGKQDGVCITVENNSHLYLVDRHIPTHNTKTTLKILESRDCKRVLIITGVSNLQEEWIKEADKHLAMDGTSFTSFLNLRIVADSPSASVASRIKYLRNSHIGEERFADLISIESLRGTPLVEAVNALKYDAIVIDECQSAKEMKAEQSQGIQEIEYHEGQIRLALSGTPVLNDPLEYYSVLRFLKVLYYKSKVSQCARTTFNTYYGVWEIDFWGNMTCKRYKNMDQLRQLLSPVIVYAPKSLLNLPQKHRTTVDLTIENPEYDRLLKIYKKGTTAAKKAGYRVIQSLAADLQFLTSTDESKKRFILSKRWERPLVFSHYTRVLDDIKSYLEKQGIEVLYYHGKLTMKERLKVLASWKAGNGEVILLSLKCARYGLNLQETQTAIFLEPPTSPAILDQAEDRLHRIGQMSEVISYLPLAGESDYLDWERLLKKREILDF